MSHLDRLLAHCLPELTSLRHDLHAHPQLGYQETYASELVQTKLREWGIPFIGDVAETGVVAPVGRGASFGESGWRSVNSALWR